MKKLRNQKVWTITILNPISLLNRCLTDQVEPITIEDTADEIADEPENNQSSEDENKSVEDVTERAIEGEQMDVDQDDGNVEDKKMEVEQIVDDVVDITDKDEVEDITDKNDVEDITDKDDDIVEVPITSKEPTDKSEIVAEEKYVYFFAVESKECPIIVLFDNFEI